MKHHTAPAPIPALRRMPAYLTPPRQQILAGIARGHSLVEIAHHRGRPAETVKCQIQRMRVRLGTPTSASLVDLAYRSGWLAGLTPEPRSGVQLTGRQIDVLEGIAAGLDTTGMAARLYLSPYTVKDHVQRLLAALRARSRAHAVALAHQHGHLQGAPAPTR